MVLSKGLAVGPAVGSRFRSVDSRQSWSAFIPVPHILASSESLRRVVAPCARDNSLTTAERQLPQPCHSLSVAIPAEPDKSPVPGAGPLDIAACWVRDAARLLGQTGVVLGASCALVLSSLPAAAETVIRIPASTDPAIFTAQKTLVQAWTIVEEAYVDADFGGEDWSADLTKALLATYGAPDGSAAFQEVQAMVAKLGDPFTRVVPPNEYRDFRVSSDGEVQGVGLLIAADPSNGRLVVLAPITGGPADRAGMQPGDEVLSIDGRSTAGWDADRAAQFLRGRTGSGVTVRFARRSEQIPGVAGRPEEPPPRVDVKQVSLKREKLELNPVFWTPMRHGQHLLGYIRLVNFSQKAANEMAHAIASLEAQGAEGFILDLRNNPGGLVNAGIDIARMWLPGSPIVFNVQGREDPAGELPMQQVVLEGGEALTERPLAVLVNASSASASEILAGALHDNGRAQVIGDPTFGKGKIQSVFELGDGSALFVTVAKYKTPALHEIDRVGIQPDRSCSLSGLPSKAPTAPGVPVGAVAQTQVMTQLAMDSCVIAAERQLGLMVDQPTNVASARARSATPLAALLPTAPALN